MTLHIRQAKGGKDRYVILSLVVYQALRDYWKRVKFKECHARLPEEHR